MTKTEENLRQQDGDDVAILFNDDGPSYDYYRQFDLVSAWYLIYQNCELGKLLERQTQLKEGLKLLDYRT